MDGAFCVGGARGAALLQGLHDLQKAFIAVHFVVADTARGHFVEEFFGALDLRLLDGAEVEAVHAAFSLRDEEDVLDLAFVESDGPVGGIVADGGRDLEAAGKFGVDADFFGGIEVLSEAALDAFFGEAIGEDIVLDGFFREEGFVEGLVAFFLGEDGAVVLAFDGVVGDVLDDHRRFLLVDELDHLGDEFFRIGVVC